MATLHFRTTDGAAVFYAMWIPLALIALVVFIYFEVSSRAAWIATGIAIFVISGVVAYAVDVRAAERENRKQRVTDLQKLDALVRPLVDAKLQAAALEAISKEDLDEDSEDANEDKQT